MFGFFKTTLNFFQSCFRLDKKPNVHDLDIEMARRIINLQRSFLTKELSETSGVDKVGIVWKKVLPDLTREVLVYSISCQKEAEQKIRLSLPENVAGFPVVINGVGKSISVEE